MPLELADQIWRDTERDIRVQVLGIIGKDLRDQRVVTFRENDEMQVCRAVWVAMLDTEQVSDGAVRGYRVTGWPQASEVEVAVRIRKKWPLRFISGWPGS